MIRYGKIYDNIIRYQSFSSIQLSHNLVKGKFFHGSVTVKVALWHRHRKTRGGAAMTFDELLRDDLLAAPGRGGAGASIMRFCYERGR